MRRLGSSPVLAAALGLAAGGVLLEFLFFHFKGRALFDLDGERNVPALYEALLFLFAGLAAFANCRRRSTFIWQWAFMGAALTYAGIDEFFCFHENITALASRALHGARLHNVWMLLYVPALYGSMRFLKGLWKELRVDAPRSAWLMALAIFAWFISFPPELLVQWEVLPQKYWRQEIMLEEALEMIGSILLFYAFLSVPRSAEGGKGP